MHISPSNKVYIGITSQKPEARWCQGEGYNKQVLFYRAIKKYGWNNFIHIVLADELSKDFACELEKFYIDIYKSNDKEYGYNLTLGGEGANGYRLTPEQIENHRRNSLGRKHSQSTKDYLSQINKGRVVSAETREKMRQAHLGKTSYWKGKKLPVEVRIKLSEAHKGKPGYHNTPHTEETKKKISEKSKGRIVSPETREKLRQKALEQWKRQKNNKNKKGD